MSKFRFQKLTPIDDAELGAYKPAFEFIFENNDICNVAISGPYGSGKSSILKTYEKECNDKKFIHISLAHFSESVKQSHKSETYKSANEDVIESEILNQLIHQIPFDKIRDTCFRVKHKIGRVRNLTMTAGIVIPLLIAVFFLFQSKWSNSLSSFDSNGARAFLNITGSYIFQLILALIAIIIGSIWIYKIIKTIINRNLLRKLYVNGAEFGLYVEADDSYFDKYLDEILYILKNSGADVFVFEDIDRFDDVRIFEKLRSINVLLNEDSGHKDGDKIKFFYLLRDDIFTPTERTKFFDFILPIIPVIDSSNSYNKLKDYLQEADLFEKFDKYFLKDLSLYLDDLRLVKNIVNEFQIFYNRLGEIELDANKSLALITYKNLFPKDYVDLQLGKGFVHEILNADLIEDDESDVTPDGQDLLNSQVKDNDSFYDVRTSDYFSLLKYLLSNGYIDKTYEDYITFFYDNDITVTDKKFLRAVTDKNGKPWDYHLVKREGVAEGIRPEKVYGNEILNYDLLEYLLKTCNEISDNAIRLQHMIELISSERCFSFVVSYYDSGRELEKLVDVINRVWPQFFSLICSEDNDDLKRIQRSYSLYSLLCSDESVLKDININNCLMDYISSQNDYLNLDLDEEYVDHFTRSLSAINVSFKGFNGQKTNEELLKKIYIASLYQMNTPNLRLFLDKYYSDKSVIDFSKCMTIIFSSPEEPLYKYAILLPNATLRAVLDITDKGINDNEKVVVQVLNNVNINQDLREKYLSRNKTIIPSLDSIDETFYDLFLDNRTVVCSVENILYYFHKRKFTMSLAEFINSSEVPLLYNTVSISDQDKKQIFNDSMKSKELNKTRFKEIAVSFGYTITNFNIKEVPEDKLEVLSELGLISCSSANLNFLRNNYSIKAVEGYVCSKVNVQQHNWPIVTSYKTNEVESILASDNFSDEDKITLLHKRNQNDKYTILDKHYPDAVYIEILKKYFRMSDLQGICMGYDSFSKVVQDEVYSIAKQNFGAVIKSEELPYTLIIRLLNTDDIDIESRINLSGYNFMRFSSAQQNEILEAIGGQEIAHALEPNCRKRASLTQCNELILQMLKNCGRINEFEEDENLGKYRFKV